jgi:hypothetical protein
MMISKCAHQTHWPISLRITQSRIAILPRRPPNITQIFLLPQCTIVLMLNSKALPDAICLKSHRLLTLERLVDSSDAFCSFLVQVDGLFVGFVVEMHIFVLEKRVDSIDLDEALMVVGFGVVISHMFRDLMLGVR